MHQFGTASIYWVLKPFAISLIFNGLSYFAGPSDSKDFFVRFLQFLILSLNSITNSEAFQIRSAAQQLSFGVACKRPSL